MGEALLIRRGGIKSNIIWFYREGSEFESITGGWVEGYSAATGSQSKQSTHLITTAGPEPGGTYPFRTYVTDMAIDLTNFNKLKVLLSHYNSAGEGDGAVSFLRVGDVKTDGAGEIAEYLQIPDTGEAVVEAELDISAVTGSHYIKVGTYAPKVSTVTGTGRFYKVWGEK